MRRAIDTGRISVKYLEKKEDMTDLLTRPWVWEQLAPAEHVLLFQADSILCSASARVEDFTEYDFVGGVSGGFNGGLSLRNREMMLDIVKSNNWRREKALAEDPSVESEGLWFQKKMRELPVREDGQPAARFPSECVAKTFSVESMWYDYPLGFHQVERWQEENMEKVDRWCPEWRMASGEELIDYKL
jgi:hypothetical protein